MRRIGTGLECALWERASARDRAYKVPAAGNDAMKPQIFLFPLWLGLIFPDQEARAADRNELQRIPTTGPENWNSLWSFQPTPLPVASAGQGVSIERLRDANPVVRRRAAEDLEEHVTPAALEALIATLRDPDTEVRRKVAQSLGAYADPKAVQALLAALQDRESTVQWSAAESLARIGSPAFAALAEVAHTGDAPQRLGAVRALGKSAHADAMQPLLHALTDEDAGVREQAAQALAGWHEPAVIDALISALSDPDAGVQGQAARSLAQLRDARAIAPLIASLRDAEPGLRAIVSVALGELGPDAVVPLIAALRDEDAGVQAGALSALSRTGSMALLPLIAALGGAPVEQRENLLEALGILGVNTSQAMREASQDRDPLLRAGAALALGRITDGDAMRWLHPLLDDADPRVREAAGQSVGKLEETYRREEGIHTF
jgi:HEAT repeat protein